MSTIQIKVVGHTGTAGTVFATLADMVSMEPLVDVLGKAGSLRFGLHNLDGGAPAVHPIEREVQVWRNGSLIAGGGWLVPITPEANIGGSTDTIEYECRGLLWYFDRLNIGKADRRDYIANSSFEAATLAPWTAVGTTATRSTTRRIDGVAAAKLVQALDGTDTFLRQSVSITAGGVGAIMTLAGWFYIPSAGWGGEALQRRGLFLQRAVSGVVKQFSVAELNTGAPGSMPFDTWQRRETTVQIPPNTTEDIEVRLYSPGTITGIWWDAVTLTAMDSLSFYDTDQASIADGIVVTLQDPAEDKVDLLIGRSAPATGVLRTRHFQHADHVNGGRALAEFAELDNGFDQSIELTSTSRTYTVNYPHKGTSRAAIAWSEIVRVRWVPVEGDQAANSIVVLGDGDGPDREEGSASDPSSFPGVRLEDIVPAEPGTPIDGLDEKAAERLRVRANARRAEVTFGPGLRIGSLLTGDTLDGPAAAHGVVDLSGTWRTVQTSLDLVSDCLTATLETAV